MKARSGKSSQRSYRLLVVYPITDLPTWLSQVSPSFLWFSHGKHISSFSQTTTQWSASDMSKKSILKNITQDIKVVSHKSNHYFTYGFHGDIKLFPISWHWIKNHIFFPCIPRRFPYFFQDFPQIFPWFPLCFSKIFPHIFSIFFGLHFPRDFSHHFQGWSSHVNPQDFHNPMISCYDFLLWFLAIHF